MTPTAGAARSVRRLQQRQHRAGGLGPDRGAAAVAEADLEVRAGREPDDSGADRAHHLARADVGAYGQLVQRPGVAVVDVVVAVDAGCRNGGPAPTDRIRRSRAGRSSQSRRRTPACCRRPRCRRPGRETTCSAARRRSSAAGTRIRRSRGPRVVPTRVRFRIPNSRAPVWQPRPALPALPALPAPPAPPAPARAASEARQPGSGRCSAARLRRSAPGRRRSARAAALSDSRAVSFAQRRSGW